MKFLANLRRLVGLAMAIMVALASVPSFAVPLAGVGVHGVPMLTRPALADQFDLLGSALYIAEESEADAASKPSSQRIGGDHPPLTPAASAAGAIDGATCLSPCEHVARLGSGLFLAPYKTGPPRI